MHVVNQERSVYCGRRSQLSNQCTIIPTTSHVHVIQSAYTMTMIVFERRGAGFDNNLWAIHVLVIANCRDVDFCTREREVTSELVAR